MANSSSSFIAVEKPEQGIVVLAPTSDIDMSRSPELRSVLRQEMGKDTHKVIIDLDGVEYMDSSGLATLVEAMRNAGLALGGTLDNAVVVGPAVECGVGGSQRRAADAESHPRQKFSTITGSKMPKWLKRILPFLSTITTWGEPPVSKRCIVFLPPVGQPSDRPGEDCEQNVPCRESRAPTGGR